jgi:hypothetical protein
MIINCKNDSAQSQTKIKNYYGERGNQGIAKTQNVPENGNSGIFWFPN